MIKNIIKTLPKYSYGRFIILKIKPTREERIIALKKFLDKVH